MDLTERVNLQKAVPTTFLIVSVYLFVGSYSYSTRAAMFPRFTSSIVIVGCLLLLFSSWLPDGMQSFVSESTDVFEMSNSPKDMPSDEEKTSESVDTHHAIRTGLLTTGYITGGYVVGLLWTSPVFVFAYCLMAKKSKSVAVLLALLGFGIAFGFMTVLNIPLAEGEVLG